MVSYLASKLSCLGSIPSIPKKISEEKIVDVAEVNQRCCTEECVQWLENVDQTHLELVSGKLVLGKSYFSSSEKKRHLSDTICSYRLECVGSNHGGQSHIARCRTTQSKAS